MRGIALLFVAEPSPCTIFGMGSLNSDDRVPVSIRLLPNRAPTVHLPKTTRRLSWTLRSTCGWEGVSLEGVT
jgi:hypothetical protein